MNVRWHLGVLLLTVVLSGCLDSDRTGETAVHIQDVPLASVEAEIMPQIEDTPPIHIYELPDRWNAAAENVMGNADDHKFFRFEVSDLGESLSFHHVWGEVNREDCVMLTGYARKDDGRIERMYLRGKQTDFGEENLRHLRPYYEILIAAADPGLSDGERSDIMSALFLDGDVAVLAERSDEDGRNTVTVGNIRYDVAVIASGEGRTYALVATMVPDCMGDSILSPCASAPQPDADQSAHEDKPPVARSPFVLPDGYQTVDTGRFTFAIPEEWHLEQKAGYDWLYFLFNGERVGETQILGWFDEETWRGFKPNHSDQTGFEQRDDLLAVPYEDVHLYRIQLTHTKPAADLDPEWKYEETRWYVADKASGLAYGFYFASEIVDESVIETIVSSFRLNEVGDIE